MVVRVKKLNLVMPLGPARVHVEPHITVGGAGVDCFKLAEYHVIVLWVAPYRKNPVETLHGVVILEYGVDALAAGREGAIKLHFPTVKTLETIEKQKTLDALVDWASSCVQWGVTSMVPVIIDRDGRKEIVLPGEKDYPGIDS